MSLVYRCTSLVLFGYFLTALISCFKHTWSECATKNQKSEKCVGCKLLAFQENWCDVFCNHFCLPFQLCIWCSRYHFQILALFVATSQLSCPFYMGLCDREKAGREGGRDIDWSSASFFLFSRTPAHIGISPTDLPYMVRSPCHSTFIFI